MDKITIYVSKKNDRFAVRVGRTLVFRGHSIGPAQLWKILQHIHGDVVQQYVDDVEKA